MGFLDRFRRAAGAPGETAAGPVPEPAATPVPPSGTSPDTSPSMGGSGSAVDRPGLGEQLEWLEETAGELVAPAFLGRKEVREVLREQYVEDDGLDLTDDDVGTVLDRVWGERLRLEAGWADEGDYARVAAAFADLEAHGVVARMGFTCCQSCGHAEIAAERGPSSRGYVFFHEQDVERLAPAGGDLFLSFGGFTVADDVVAGEVVAALRSQGLAVEWDGTSAQRVHVSGVDWRKRVPRG